MKYQRMPIEIESPEELGYGTIQYNLAESSYRDQSLEDVNIHLKDVVLCYGEHRGATPLREAIIDNSKILKPKDVLVTTGAAMALFMIATSLLNKKNHLVVIRPNYGTNLETPRAMQVPMTIVDLKFENGFQLDIEKIKKAMRPTTKIISITQPHNPTGVLFPEKTLHQLIEIAEANDCYLLVDETYRELNFQTALQPFLAELSPRVISVGSLSKAYGVPGIRTGWLICRDVGLINLFLAAKEQICIGNSVLDEAAAFQVLQQRTTLIPKFHAHIKSNFELLTKHFAENKFVEYVAPSAGCVCFPRLKKEFEIDFEKFKHMLYHDYKTVVGFGHWFEQPDKYFRIGFGYPLADELTQGLLNFRNCIENTLK